MLFAGNNTFRIHGNCLSNSDWDMLKIKTFVLLFSQSHLRDIFIGERLFFPLVWLGKMWARQHYNNNRLIFISFFSRHNFFKSGKRDTQITSQVFCQHDQENVEDFFTLFIISFYHRKSLETGLELSGAGGGRWGTLRTKNHHVTIIKTSSTEGDFFLARNYFLEIFGINFHQSGEEHRIYSWFVIL